MIIWRNNEITNYVRKYPKHAYRKICVKVYPIVFKTVKINMNRFHLGFCKIFDYVELRRVINITSVCYFSKWKNIIQTELRKTFVEPASQTREKRARFFAFCSRKKKAFFSRLQRRKKEETSDIELRQRMERNAHALKRLVFHAKEGKKR